MSRVSCDSGRKPMGLTMLMGSTSIVEILFLVCVPVWVYFIARWALLWTHLIVLTPPSLSIRKFLRGHCHGNYPQSEAIGNGPQNFRHEPNAWCLENLWRCCETLPSWLTIISLMLVKVEEAHAVKQNKLVNADQVQILGRSKKTLIC